MVPRTLAVVTTVATLDDARRLAREIVTRGLAACAQSEPIESIYVWDGALQQEGEVRLTFKTTDLRWPDLHRAIRELHPYTLPQVVAFECAEVDADYARWVAVQSGCVPGPDETGDA